MITTEKLYGIQCDICGTYYVDEHNGIGFWLEIPYAEESAMNKGWYCDDKHYCPNCHTINDDDELVINAKP